MSIAIKDKLAEANNLSRASTIYVDSNIRNAEVVNAMGMRNNISKVWAHKYYGFLNAQNIASDSAGVWSNLSKSLRVMFQSLILGLGAYLAINMEVTPGMMIAASIIMGRALAPLWFGLLEAGKDLVVLEVLMRELKVC